MSLKVVFVERRDPETPSLERVFSIIGDRLRALGFEVSRRKLRFGNSFIGIIGNCFVRKPSDFDIYHITGQAHYYALFLPASKTVITIHDLVVLNYRTGLRRYFIKKLFFDLPVRRAKYITVVSEQTKNELAATTGCSPEKITVIENPLAVKTEDHERPFNVDCPRILHIGTAPHKNLSNLIKALKDLDCNLAIVGEIDPLTVELLNANSIRFENRSGLSDDELMREYRNSDIVSFCSFAEGFGLPIVEAQALSVPLITSDISPMKDVAGDGAILVDPYNPESIRSGIIKLIEDRSLQAKVIEKGRANIARFEPALISSRYAELYTRIADPEHGNSVVEENVKLRY